MQVYQVGGSIRDELLGLPVADRDWVVVGATPEAMLDAGFVPVGRDFPVFLHPLTHEEYALARTERKTAPGYKGFVFHAAAEVTLEQDLARRDFTVNAIARVARQTRAGKNPIWVAGTDQPLIDPFDGRRDIGLRVLRHVGPAFAEDPVRILRCARFVSRLGFAVDPDTLELMRTMTAAGEVDALVPERVWQEISRGLMADNPGAMLALLDAAGALDRIATELAPWDAHSEVAQALGAAVRAGAALPVRFAVMCSSLGFEAVRGLCERIRAPRDCLDLALLHAKLHRQFMRAGSLDSADLVELVRLADGLRRPEQFRALTEVVRFAVAGAPGTIDFAVAERCLNAALEAVRSIDAGAIARVAGNPASIQVALHAARQQAVTRALAGLRG